MEKRKRYRKIRNNLYWHYLNFYKQELLPLKENESVEEQEFEYLWSTFKTVYHRALEQLRINLDETQLGLQMDQYTFDDIETEMSKKETALFTKIAMKWNILELGIKEDEFVVESGNALDSRSLKRIEFVMELFEDYFLKQTKDDTFNYIDIVMKCLSDYNAIALLNDFDHIRGHKKEIKDLIVISFDDESDGQNIGELMRKYRKNERGNDDDDSEKIPTEFKQFVDGLDLRERHLFETSVKIHCFLCYEVNNDVEDEQKEDDDIMDKKLKAQRSRGRIDASNSKFVNEIQSQSKHEKTERKRMDTLSESLREKGLSDVHCSQFERMLIVEQYDSETIIHDLVDEDDRFNMYPDTNLFPILQNNVYLAKITKKHFGQEGNDDDKFQPFTFGMTELVHTESYKDWPGYVGAPKYDSLKEECLNNKIHSMSQEQFARHLHAAYSLTMTMRGRKMRAMDRNGKNKASEIPVDSPFSVSHVFVLLIYCNDTDLQYKYKKFGCRERDNEQTLDELKQWNTEIAHWHRLLIEDVAFFGELVTSKQVFYMGLNTKLSFETFAPMFYAPFSTTVSFDVANGFCGEDQEGLILKLQSADGSGDMYFDVEWISDFVHEQERLFAVGYNLRISDIGYYEGYTLRNTARYLKAFNLFSSLFGGCFIFNLLRLKIKKDQNRAWRVLLDLINVYCANNNIPNVHQESIGLSIRIPIYVQQLFYHLLDGFRRNKDSKYLIKSQFDLLDDSLKSEFMMIPDQDTSDLQTDDIRFTPFMQSLCGLGSIRFMQEYIWIIAGDQMKELQRAKMGKGIYSDAFYLRIPDHGKVPLTLWLDRKRAGSQSVWIGIEWKQTPFTIDATWCVAVDELEYVLNNQKFFGEQTGNNVPIFDDNLIETLDTMTVHVAICVTKSTS